jgi:hypothetical protein
MPTDQVRGLKARGSSPAKALKEAIQSKRIALYKKVLIAPVTV